MKQRDFYFDNAKFILIFLVVFGHLLRSIIEETQGIYSLYKVIYSFHMPAFILVSGFFAKGFNQKGYIGKIAKKLIVPYLIFQIIYSVFYYFLNKESELLVDPFDPHWSLWFLISLFCWNIILIPFTKLKPVLGLTLSLLFGLGIGYIDWASNYLSISRTFVFFPFFLLGYHLKKDHFYTVLNPKMKALALVICTLVFTGFYLYPNINYEWLLGSKSYGEMGIVSFTDMFNRLGFYILSFMMVTCFYVFVPKRQLFFTRLGKNTLYVYLLHGFFIRVFRESRWEHYFHNPETFLLLALVVSLFLTLILSSKISISFAQPFIELKMSQLKKLINQGISSFKVYQKKLFE